MPEVKQIYKSASLEALFGLEEDIITKIMIYCLNTNKDVEVEYQISGNTPNIFLLQIKIIQL